MDKDFEHVDQDAEVEKVMHQIRENVRKRRLGYDFPAASAKDPGYCPNKSISCSYDVQKVLDDINSNWDITNDNYYISSHRLVLGKFLVKGRELVHGEVCRYIDPQISRQIEFNANLVKIINEMVKKIYELEEIIRNLEKNNK